MPTETGTPHVPREERRRRTEQAILDAAKELFGECGFDRTTIRGVAGRAGVDPALVMQYFGSKAGLFAAAARWSDDTRTVEHADLDAVPAAALHDMFERFEGAGADRESAVALIRACLTHPEAARVMRDEVMCDRIGTVAATIGGDDAELRAGLVGACMIGVTIARHLLLIEPVTSADRGDLERLLEPALRALVSPDGP